MVFTCLKPFEICVKSLAAKDVWLIVIAIIRELVILFLTNQNNETTEGFEHCPTVDRI